MNRIFFQCTKVFLCPNSNNRKYSYCILIPLLTSLGISVFLCSCTMKERVESVSYYEGSKQIQLKSEGYWKKNPDGSTEIILDGPYRTWYQSGQLHTELFLRDNVIIGQATIWWPNGNIRVKNNFNAAGQIDGEQYVYDRNRNLLKSYRMDNGTGIEYRFHENGKLKSEYTRKGGVLNGVAKTYDEKGKLISTATYANGVKVDKNATP